ncbi:MAG: TIGR02147 family protein [Pseudobdellovibrionaceae bacterium]
MKNLFQSTNYRSYVNDWLKHQTSTFGLLSKMAKALNCQNSHLTRVLKEEVHFTMDQAFNAAEFLHLTDNETNYFLKLVEHERSGDPKFRQRLKNEMERLQADHENLSKRLNDKIIQASPEFESLYYSSWIWSAVHVITDIPEFQTPDKIARRLNLNEKQVRMVLEKLESFGLVKNKNQRWIFVSGVIHLPKTSPMNSVQHGNWRTQAVLQSQNIEDEGLHYSIVQAISHKDLKKIRQLLFDTIQSYRSIANPSTPEELTCFTLDFFKV